MMWYVRSFMFEGEAPRQQYVYIDEGPWDRYLAEMVLADIGVDGTIPRGIGRVRVERAILVEVNFAAR
jgi:hypothetical protein